MKLTKEQIDFNKKQIIDLLLSTKRKGIDELLNCLEDGGYFTAKCHSHHHFVGGLMVHSLSTCKIALARGEGLSRDSVIICALLHDLCDIRGFDEYHGHGERSMRIAMSYMELSPAERCAIRNHMRKEYKVSHSWDEVLAIPENKALYRLVYEADKNSAKHDNPLLHMKHVRGGNIRVSYEGYGKTYEEVEQVKDFYISQELVTWRLWRFVMGNDVKPLVEFEDEVDHRDSMPLVGEMRMEQRDEFLRRLKEMTGKEYAFPSLTQWDAARRQKVCIDLGNKLELLNTGSGAVLAGDNKGNSMPCEPTYGGIDWAWIGYRLVTSE